MTRNDFLSQLVLLTIAEAISLSFLTDSAGSYCVVVKTIDGSGAGVSLQTLTNNWGGYSGTDKTWIKNNFNDANNVIGGVPCDPDED